jgi:hypothetical protein
MIQPHVPHAISALPLALKAVLERANAGDASALPELKQAFDQHPELILLLGDLAQHVQETLVNLIVGPSLTGREAVVRHAETIREELLATAASPLERLLAQRVVLAWLWSHQADLDVAQRLAQGQGASPATREADKRRHHAHLQFLAATRAQAVVQRLLGQPLAPAQRHDARVPEQSPEAKRPKLRRRASPREAAA